MEELDLKEIFNLFWIRKAQIALIILIFIMIGVGYTLFMVTPKYRASTTLVLAKVEDGGLGDASITQTEIALNQKLISTYGELIKSKAVLRQVIDNLGLLDVNEEYLRKNVTVTAVKNTEFMQISVTHENYQYVDVIANEIANVFADKVEEIYSINNVRVVDKAEQAITPYNINHIKDVAIFVAIGMMVSVGYAILANMIDNTVKASEDIERRTNLTVLSTIPNYDRSLNKGGENNG